MTTDARKIRLLMHLRRQGITDNRVLSAMERVPRELFVPPELADVAYEDRPLPIGRGQTISQPLIVARMTQWLRVGERDKVLEVGTGSGYQAAILAKLCRRLYTMERHRPLMAPAEERFAELGLTNITPLVGDGMLGWPQQAPFDGIIVTAGHRGDRPPPALLEQVRVGRHLILPVGADAQSQWLVRYTPQADGGLEEERLCQVRFVPLLPEIASDAPGSAVG